MLIFLICASFVLTSGCISIEKNRQGLLSKTTTVEGIMIETPDMEGIGIPAFKIYGGFIRTFAISANTNNVNSLDVITGTRATFQSGWPKQDIVTFFALGSNSMKVLSETKGIFGLTSMSDNRLPLPSITINKGATP